MMSAQPDPLTSRATQAFLRAIAADFDPAGAILYGSRARRTHAADSDADVAVLLRGPHRRFLPTMLALSDVAFDVMLETGINISPLPIWLDEWENPQTHANPQLLSNIAAEGIPL